MSTLVGTFASSHNLYERLKQTKKDANQDDKIKKLEEKFETEMKKKDGGGNDKSDELKNTLNSSGPLIRREYDVGFDRLGRRFAAGDSKCAHRPTHFIRFRSTLFGSRDSPPIPQYLATGIGRHGTAQ